MEITWPIFGIFEISFKSAYSPIIILLNILNYAANLCLKQFIQNDLDFPFDYCNRNYHFKGGGVLLYPAVRRTLCTLHLPPSLVSPVVFMRDFLPLIGSLCIYVCTKSIFCHVYQWRWQKRASPQSF